MKIKKELKVFLEFVLYSTLDNRINMPLKLKDYWKKYQMLSKLQKTHIPLF
jgi:hypothetical protein